MTRGHLVKCIALGAAILAGASALSAEEPERHYFTNVRDVQVSAPTQTNYIAVDNEIWSHARPDLADIRLYNGDHIVPYALRMQGIAEISELHPVRILNKGVVPNYTQFLLDMSGFDVYDEISLELSQHDFDRLVMVEGANTANAKTWTQITTAPIFDFTKEKLGANLTIKMPPSNFRFLRVSISRRGIDHGNLVLPQNIHGATASNTFRSNAVWDETGGTIRRKERPHETLLFIDMVKAAPVDRIHFEVPADRVNFRRLVSVETRSDDNQSESDEEGWQPIVEGDISRIRSQEGTVAEDVDILTHDTRAAHWRVVVRNGDDAPLPVKPMAQTLERRLYFNPNGATSFKLYYGDPKVGAPAYEYDKLFRDSDTTSAVPATLGAGMHNVQAAARPDERPWTERHKWVLWLAMVVAILGIGGVALRGLKKA